MTTFLEYLHAGLSCIPIRADGSKAAAIPWREFCGRLPTEAECQSWQEHYAGVAIIGGAVSGNLEIVDIDEPSLVRPFIDALRSQDASLPHRLTYVQTPRRNEIGKAGCHLYFRCAEPIPGNTKLAMSEPEPDIDTDGKLRMHPATGEPVLKPRTLIETRGEGGYVLTVGCSAACHPTGNLYEHVYGPPLAELAVLSAAERDTIHQVARMFDRSISETHEEPSVRGYERHGDKSPGDSFNERATWPQILEPHGWHCIGESGGVKRWRRPGKSTGISATTGLLSKQGNELLVVFSTNAHPFEGIAANGRQGVTYSKFGAYTLLNHTGDYQASAKALLDLGYGTPASKRPEKARVLRGTVHDAETRYLELLTAGQTELMSLGLPSLDKALDGGVERAEMVIIGGLPSHGKSVCGLQALRATVESGRNGVLVSHEMGGLAIAKRMILARTPFGAEHWRDKIDVLKRDCDAYWSVCGEMFLLEQCRQIDDIEKAVDQIAREYDLGMIVIDHAQLTVGKGINRYEQLSDASARFKDLAVKHNCVCLVLSQLNRQAAAGDAGAHHLRESGALEQDADVIIMVRWPWKADPESEPAKKYTFRILKNRNRAIVRWEVAANFIAARQMIEPADEPAEPYSEFTEWSH